MFGCRHWPRVRRRCRCAQQHRLLRLTPYPASVFILNLLQGSQCTCDLSVVLAPPDAQCEDKLSSARNEIVIVLRLWLCRSVSAYSKNSVAVSEFDLSVSATANTRLAMAAMEARGTSILE